MIREARRKGSDVWFAYNDCTHEAAAEHEATSLFAQFPDDEFVIETRDKPTDVRPEPRIHEIIATRKTVIEITSLRRDPQK